MPLLITSSWYIYSSNCISIIGGTRRWMMGGNGLGCISPNPLLKKCLSSVIEKDGKMKQSDPNTADKERARVIPHQTATLIPH